MTDFRPYDSAEFLTDDVALREYMNEALATNDSRLIAHAVGVVARARNMTAIARKSGLSRGSLYRALSEDGRPELDTVLRVLDAVGMTLTVSAPSKAAKRATAKRPVKRAGTAGLFVEIKRPRAKASRHTKVAVKTTAKPAKRVVPA